MSFPPSRQQQKRRGVKVVDIDSDSDEEIVVVDCVAGNGQGVPFQEGLALEVVQDLGPGSSMNYGRGIREPDVEFVGEVRRVAPVKYVLETSDDETDTDTSVGSSSGIPRRMSTETEPQLSHSIEVDDHQQQGDREGEEGEAGERNREEHEGPPATSRQERGAQVAGQSVPRVNGDNQENWRFGARSDENMEANGNILRLQGCYPINNVNKQESHSSTSTFSSRFSPRVAAPERRARIGASAASDSLSSPMFRVASEAEIAESFEWWQLELEESDTESVPSPEELISINEFRDAFLAASVQVDKEFEEKEKKKLDNKKKKKKFNTSTHTDG